MWPHNSRSKLLRSKLLRSKLLGSGKIPAADAAKMKGYLKSCKFVLHMALYQDLVDDMADLSLEFQRDELPLSAVRSSVVVAQVALRRKKMTPGPHLRPVLAAVNEAVGN